MAATFRNNEHLWLWVPAFAGTTIQPNLNESLIFRIVAAAFAA